jgi:hypothetical protein
VPGGGLVQGFIRAADGTLTTGFRDPHARAVGTFWRGINSQSGGMGNCFTNLGGTAFLFQPPNQFFSYSVSNADTSFTGITDQGLISGVYLDSAGQSHGIIVQVVR